MATRGLDLGWAGAGVAGRCTTKAGATRRQLTGGDVLNLC